MSFLSEIGGLIYVLKLLLGLIMIPLGQYKLKAIISNRLFHLTDFDIPFRENIDRFINYMKRKPNGSIGIRVSDALDFEFIINKVFYCCRSNEFKVFD